MIFLLACHLPWGRESSVLVLEDSLYSCQQHSWSQWHPVAILWAKHPNFLDHVITPTLHRLALWPVLAWYCWWHIQAVASYQGCDYPSHLFWSRRKVFNSVRSKRSPWQEGRKGYLLPRKPQTSFSIIFWGFPFAKRVFLPAIPECAEELGHMYWEGNLSALSSP